MNATRTRSLRLRRLRAALALQGRTQGDFATELGVSGTHLCMVASGQRHSPRVEAAIDALIDTAQIPETIQ